MTIQGALMGSLRNCRSDQECGGGVCYRGLCSGLLDTDALWLQERLTGRLVALTRDDAAERDELLAALIDVIGSEKRAALPRSRAVALLGAMGAMGAMDAKSDGRADALLERAATDPAPAVRMRALLALGERGRASALEGLRTLADDPSEGVRTALVHALGSIGTPEVLDMLSRAAFEDDASTVRIEAVRAMGRVRSKGAAERLLRVIEEGPGYLHYDAAVGLRKLTGMELGVGGDEWQKALASWSGPE